MIAEIVSVGTELLMGQVLNTDAQHIARHIAPLGLACRYQITVGDNASRLAEVVHTALSRADVVFFTGGLGPTDDDLTKETVAAALGLHCEPVPEEVERLTAYFRDKGREMTPNNLKQACFPRDAILLPNPNGTAPGCIMEANGKAAILLPGPPRELFPMFDTFVLPYLERISHTHLYSRELRIFGLGESKLAYLLRDMIENQTNPTIAPYAKTGEVTLRLTAQCETDAAGEAMLRPMIEEIRRRIGDTLYSDEGKTLAEVDAALLTERGKTLALAESCTGGMVTSALVDVPGCSAFLTEGDVTYQNEAKMRRLGVSKSTLDAHTAVSRECALEMAQGVRAAAGADLGLATTGIAGPDGGSETQPVGLVYIAIADENGAEAVELHLYGDRARIRETATLHALDLLRRKCLNRTFVRDIL